MTLVWLLKGITWVYLSLAFGHQVITINVGIYGGFFFFTNGFHYLCILTKILCAFYIIMIWTWCFVSFFPGMINIIKHLEYGLLDMMRFVTLIFLILVAYVCWIIEVAKIWSIDIHFALWLDTNHLSQTL